MLVCDWVYSSSRYPSLCLRFISAFLSSYAVSVFFFFQAEDGIRDKLVTGVQTCALPISPQPGQDDLVLAHRGHPQGAARFFTDDTLHVGHVQLVAHARQVDERLHHLRGALDGSHGSLQRERVAAQRHPHAEALGELDQVAVVDPGEGEGVDTLGRDAVGDVVAHRFTSMCSVASSAGPAGAGAPSNTARAGGVFRDAITSPSQAPPAGSNATPTKPHSKPPCGGAPAASAARRKPNRASASSGVSPRCPNTRRCTAGSVMRIEHEPSSWPL